MEPTMKQKLLKNENYYFSMGFHFFPQELITQKIEFITKKSEKLFEAGQGIKMNLAYKLN